MKRFGILDRYVGSTDSNFVNLALNSKFANEKISSYQISWKSC